MEYNHVPVMLDEVLEALGPTRGGYFIDCTLGGGGYLSAISKSVGPEGRVLGIDLDEKAIENATKKNLNNIVLARDNFADLLEIVKKNFKEDTLFDGVVLDLGLSSYQLSDEQRGFSFKNQSGDLNMSFSQEEKNKTKNIINYFGEKELERIIRDYGEERWAKKIAGEIVKERKNNRIETVGQLVEIIMRAIPKRMMSWKIHPATKTFQALRIASNNELKSLEKVLPQAISCLKPGGKLVVVSFHSLEDRIVKKFFKKEEKDCLCPPKFPVCCCGHKKSLKIITKKALVPTDKEISKNPRSRSAKMRVAEKI